MSDNNIRYTTSPKQNRRRTLKTRYARSSKRATIQSKNVLPTKGNIALEKKMRENFNKALNLLKIKQRRSYITDTMRAGADEFNNTKLRAKKGGPAYTTGEIAKHNKGKLIKGSGAPTARANTAANILMLTIGAAAERGLLGTKVKNSYNEFNSRKDKILEPGFFNKR